MGDFGAIRRKGFVVVFQRGFRIEAEIELIQPAEFKPRFGKCIVTALCGGMTFG